MAASSKGLPKFSKLHVQHSIEVHFTQGADYACRFTSPDPSLNKFVRTEVVDDTLRIFVTADEEYNKAYRRLKKKYDEVKVSLEVTAPQLEAVSVTGVSTFTAGSLKAKTFHLTVGRVSRAVIDRLETTGRTQIELQKVSKATIGSLQCADLSVQATGVSAFDCKNLKAKNTRLWFNDVSKGNVSESLDCDSLNVLLNKVSSFEVKKASARSGVLLACNETSKLEGTLKTQADATVMLNSASNGQSTIEARALVVKTKGVSRAELRVNCKSLKVENERVSRVKLSGFADHVDIDSAGVSNVDTSELNKY